MDIKQLEAFAVVLDQGSFSKAAKVLFLSQPTISAHVQNLEREFGIKLIERTTRSVTATPAGRRLYIYAREVLNIFHEMQNDSSLHAIAAPNEDLVEAEGLQGSITIASSVIPSHYLLPRAMGAFQRKNPDVRFQLITSDSQRALRLVITKQVDMAVTGSKIPHMDVSYTPVGEDELLVITPNTPEFRALGQGGFPMQELLSFPFLTREEGSGTRAETFRFLHQAGLNTRRLNITMEVSDSEIIKQSVAQGLGIAIMSGRSVGDFVQFGMVLAFPLREIRMVRTLYLIQNHSSQFSPQASAFAKLLQDSNELRN